MGWGVEIKGGSVLIIPIVVKGWEVGCWSAITGHLKDSAGVG